MTDVLPEVSYSRKAAVVVNSPHFLALPAEQQWALRDALAEHQSEETLPPHLKRLFSESIHPVLAEAFREEQHPRGRSGRFVRLHFHDGRAPAVLMLDSQGIGLNMIRGQHVDEHGEPAEVGGYTHREVWTDEVKAIDELRFERGKLTTREILTDGPAKEHLSLLFLAGDKPWAGALTSDEVEALGVYQDQRGFKAINDGLRAGEHANTYTHKRKKYEQVDGVSKVVSTGDVTRTVAEWARLLDSAIAKAPPTDVHLRVFVHRGVRDAGAVFGPEGPKVGQRITDKAYVSTTTDVETARNFAENDNAPWLDGTKAPSPAVLQIEVPPGVQTAWMSGARSLDLAEELVLARGSTFEVTDVYDELGKNVGERIPLVEMRLVPDEPRLLESGFDPALHPRGRYGKFIRFLHSMPRNSMERLASYSVTRTHAGHWIVEPDVGDTRRHDTPESAADHMMRVADAAKKPAIDMEEFAAIFDRFSHNGLRARVDSTWGGGVSGTVLDADGKYAGTFTREIDKQTDGSYRVYHDTLKLNPEAQGRGFGTAFFEHSISEYKKHPEIREVGVTAADRVGGYQWARRGFDFDVGRYEILGASLWVNQPDRRGDLYDNERYARAYAVHELWLNRFMGTSFAAWKLYGGVPDEMWQEFQSKFPSREDMAAYIHGDDSALDGKFTSPVEIAMFGREHTWIEEHDSQSAGVEMWLGKRFLVGAAWHGTLPLV